MAYDITTNSYREKMAKAVAGTEALPKITTICVGTGGLDVSGNPKTPIGTETGLYNQVLTRSVGTPTFPTATQAQFELVISPTDLPANTQITEAGLFDEDGDFASISTFYIKATDGSTTMTIDVIMQQ